MSAIRLFPILVLLPAAAAGFAIGARPAAAVTVNESYTVSCGPNGSAVLTTTPSGQTSTIPLTIGWLGVTGLYNPPAKELQTENSRTFVPTSRFPVYARRGGAFTARVYVYPPGNWPATVTETATVGATGTTGALSWQAQGTPLTAHLYVAGFVLPKAPPNGSTLTLTVTATDACGSASQTWSDVVTLAGRPEWDFVTLGS